MQSAINIWERANRVIKSYNCLRELKLQYTYIYSQTVKMLFKYLAIFLAVSILVSNVSCSPLVKAGNTLFLYFKHCSFIHLVWELNYVQMIGNRGAVN